MESEQKEKIAIIAPGGGTRCAYSAGAFVALGEKLGFNEPDILITSSGSAGAALYYITGQYDCIRKVWLRMIPNSRFISFFRRQVMDIDYLVDVLFKKEAPLNLDALKKSKTDWHIAVTEVGNGDVHYITKRNDVDPYEALRATKAVPIVYDELIEMETKRFVDGDVGSTTADFIRTAIREGATTIITLESTVGRPSWLYRLVLRWYGRRFSEWMRYAIDHNLNEMGLQYTPPPGITILRVYPSKELSTKIVSRNAKHLLASFQLGMHDVLAHHEIKNITSHS